MTDPIASDPLVLGGVPVFAGTRVPVHTLFEYIEENYTVDQFLECFPTVSLEMVHKVLDDSESALLRRRTA